MARIVEAGRVRVGERDLVVAKPTLKVARAAEEHLAQVAAFAGGRAYEFRALQLGVLVTLLRPAQPDLTVEALEEELLQDEVDGLFGQVLEVAGFKPKAASPGEAGGP